MALLGMDIGSKNIGIAVSDESNSLALPLTTLTFDGAGNFIGELKKIINDYKIETIIIGAPYSLNMDAAVEINFAMRKTLDKIELLKKYIELPIILQDERFSSAAAFKSLTFENSKPSTKRSNKIKQQKKLKNIDTLAAAYILQTYLDSQK